MMHKTRINKRFRFKEFSSLLSQENSLFAVSREATSGVDSNDKQENRKETHETLSDDTLLIVANADKSSKISSKEEIRGRSLHKNRKRLLSRT
jgi:hypothetical protein